MISQDSVDRVKNERKAKKNFLSKNLNKMKTKNQFPSIEELMKLCRPFTVTITRCETFHTSMEKVKSKFLK